MGQKNRQRSPNLFAGQWLRHPALHIWSLALRLFAAVDGDYLGTPLVGMFSEEVAKARITIPYKFAAQQYASC